MSGITGYETVMLILQVAAVTATTIVLMTALPCASMNVILSERYDCAPKFCARTFVLSFALMAITMPLMMMLCMYFFPAT